MFSLRIKLLVDVVVETTLVDRLILVSYDRLSLSSIFNLQISKVEVDALLELAHIIHVVTFDITSDDIPVDFDLLVSVVVSLASHITEKDHFINKGGVLNEERIGE